MKSSAAIRAKLMKIAKTQNLSFQLIIFRFLHERLLHRLSVSKFKDNFILKGRNLLYAFQNVISRPTKDVDFLGINISNREENLLSAFKEILAIKVDDSVWFDIESFESEKITENNKYNGFRICVNSGFDTIQQKIQIDIGFGDVVVPELVKLDYPLLINDMEPILLFAYSKETVIAEKLHAMVSLSFFNSRMKDFYDVHTLLFQNKINPEHLSFAIKATFENRKLSPGKIKELKDQSYTNDKNLNVRWKQFLSNNNLSLDRDFAGIVLDI